MYHKKLLKDRQKNAGALDAIYRFNIQNKTSPDGPFLNFRALKSGDRIIYFCSGTSRDWFWSLFWKGRSGSPRLLLLSVEALSWESSQPHRQTYPPPT